MLAKLLRRMLLAQFLIGAGLGYLLVTKADWPTWAIGACAVFMPLLGGGMASIITALKSRASGEPLSMWWRSLLGEIAASVQVFVLRQPWATSPPSYLPATGAVARVPVVLVHGYVCNHRIWDDTIAALRAAGHPVLAVDLEPLFTSIDSYAKIVDAAVNEIRQKSGASQVALIGHSMGGLVIRAWMRAHGTTRVAKVITLGTPHAGTQIAPGTRTPNGQQMAWKSQWLGALLAQESDATRALIRIALTPQDNIVYPQREQVLPGSTPVVFDGIGHLQMCLNKPVIHWVVQELSTIELAK
jgi:triacylglycerol lipase